jgi:Ca-activated chloride channel family protein
MLKQGFLQWAGLMSLLCTRILTANQQDFVLKTDSNLVVLDVSVVNAKGNPVAGLTKSEFAVFEDGKRQDVKQFSAAESPVVMGLVLDMSGSMGPKAEGVRRSVNLLLGASSPQDQYFVTGFNDRARLALPSTMRFSSKPSDIDQAMARFRCEGRTAVYDGIALALEHFNQSMYERRVMILVSDGKDTASKISRSELLDRVRKSLTTVYTIGLYRDEDVGEHNSGFLRELAHISGGRFYHPDTEQDLETSCLRIARDIRARYSVAYTPRDATKTEVRKVHVELQRRAKDDQKLTVRTRREYMIPGSKLMSNATGTALMSGNEE